MAFYCPWNSISSTPKLLKCSSQLMFYISDNLPAVLYCNITDDSPVVLKNTHDSPVVLNNTHDFNWSSNITDDWNGYSNITDDWNGFSNITDDCNRYSNITDDCNGSSNITDDCNGSSNITDDLPTVHKILGHHCWLATVPKTCLFYHCTL